MKTTITLQTSKGEVKLDMFLAIELYDAIEEIMINEFCNPMAELGFLEFMSSEDRNPKYETN